MSPRSSSSTDAVGRGSRGAERQQPVRRQPSRGETRQTRRSLFVKICRVAATLFCIFLGSGLIVTGYAGHVSPLTHSSLWGVLPLLFGVFFWACVAVGVACLFFFRRGSGIILIALVISFIPALDFCPLNFVKPKSSEGVETFTLLSYNCLGLTSRDGVYPGYNRQISKVISADADIVCLQEGAGLHMSARTDLTSAQLDTLHRMYPYICIGGAGNEQVMMSKYEVEPIHLDVSLKSFRGGDLAAYRVTLPSGRIITVFNVHLQSMNIKSSEVKTDSINTGDVRRIVKKLRKAAQGRARQTNKLVQWMRQYGGPDVIVCGDFNDVQGCHTINTLADMGFKSAYRQTGLGPMITYNADRLYFRIDHILYRGDIKALKMNKSTVKYSDHYPVMAEFAVER